jgi:hypothetical protein
MEPTQETSFDVFISHFNKDAHAASAIRQDLQSLRISFQLKQWAYANCLETSKAKRKRANGTALAGDIG